MKGKKKKKKIKYTACYEGEELRLRIKRGICLKINLRDDLEVGILVAKLREAGLGSSREIGRLFKRSASTLGMSIGLKTLKRYLTDIGIAEARGRLRGEGVLVKTDIDGQDEEVAAGVSNS